MADQAQDKPARITPADVVLDPNGAGIADVFIGTLHKAELEFTAVLIARYHHVHGLTEWAPITRRQIASLFETDDVTRKWGSNPFWRPDPFTFTAQGYIDGWNDGPDAPGMLTQKFFDAVEAERPARERRARAANG